MGRKNSSAKQVLRLRQLRRSRELTQAEMAARIGVSVSTYNAIEKRRYSPSLGLALEIAAVFHLPVEEVFGCVEVTA